jgi:hypothetical protein
MATNVELARDAVSVAKLATGKLEVDVAGDENGAQLRALAHAAFCALVAAETLLVECVNAEKFAQIRRAHGLT